MSELDDFRPRILNWSRLYRNRFRREQSPLAAILDTLKLMKGDPRMLSSEARVRLDQADADLLMACYMRLDADRRKILFVAYLDRHCTETYECMRDEKRAEYIKALKVGCSSSKDYRYFLKDAETALMDVVHRVEDKTQLDFSDSGVTESEQHKSVGA